MLSFTAMKTKPPFPILLFERLRSLAVSSRCRLHLGPVSTPSRWKCQVLVSPACVPMLPFSLSLHCSLQRPVSSHHIGSYGTVDLVVGDCQPGWGLVQSQLPDQWWVSMWRMVPCGLVQLAMGYLMVFSGVMEACLSLLSWFRSWFESDECWMTFWSGWTVPNSCSKTVASRIIHTPRWGIPIQHGFGTTIQACPGTVHDTIPGTVYIGGSSESILLLFYKFYRGTLVIGGLGLVPRHLLGWWEAV